MSVYFSICPVCDLLSDSINVGCGVPKFHMFHGQVISKCGVDPDQEPKLEHTHRKAWLRQVKQQQQRQRQLDEL